MQDISKRLDDLLDRFFPAIVAFVLYLVYRAWSNKADEKKEQEFTDALYGSSESAVKEKAVSNSAAKVIKEQPKTDWKSGMISTGTKTADEQKALDNYEVQEDKKTAAQYAQRLNVALNPSGFSMLSGSDGTDEADIFRIFDALKTDKSKYKITYAMVAENYKTAYGRNLRTELESELSANDLKRLFA